MRNELLIVNPNTNLAVTGWLAEEARRVAGTAFDIVAVNARSGLEAIQTPEDIEIAAQAVSACVADRRGAAGAIVAAFGDPGLRASRALALMPVEGLGESGMRAAAADGGTFSIVTLGAAMRAPILARAAALGLSGQLVDVRVLPFSIPEMIANREARREEIAAAVASCAAGAVLLGGAPFAGMARWVSRETGRMVIDGVEAAVEAIVTAT
jgi:allantoin racemase